MVKYSRFIFGYRKIKIPREKIKDATSLLLRGKILSEFFYDGTLIVGESDFEKVKHLFSEDIDYEASELLGLPGYIKRMKHKLSFVLAFVFTAFLLAVLSNLVWDVRIEGNEKYSDAEIIYELSENGFSVGKFWSSIDRSLMETETLKNSDSIGWININRRGSVAYVSVIEKDSEGERDLLSTVKYSNIVASTDCVIEEITVIRGVALVRVGDTVKKGDLLISGVMTSDGGVCRAEGSVVGRMNDKVCAKTCRNYEARRLIGEKLCSLSLNLFNFSINILKMYGNLAEECVIIDDVKEYSLFGGLKLPFSIKREYARNYLLTNETYSDAEIVDLTAKKLASAIQTRTVGADLLKIRTFGDFTGEGYEMFSEIVFLADIGQEVEFVVE